LAREEHEVVAARASCLTYFHVSSVGFRVGHSLMTDRSDPLL
jgi:hypothetical protein